MNKQKYTPLNNVSRGIAFSNEKDGRYGEANLRHGTEEVGQKFDTGKPRWDLLPWIEVEEIVKVLTNGSTKYSDNNWKFVPNAKERYFAAAERHITAWRKGELFDDEDGLHHLSHAGCCLLFLRWLDSEGEEKDKISYTADRPRNIWSKLKCIGEFICHILIRK